MSIASAMYTPLKWSCPSRGTWIEIGTPSVQGCAKPGRAPHGARGLKSFAESGNPTLVKRRAPHGARGLKLLLLMLSAFSCPSCPSRGTWIEMRVSLYGLSSQIKSCPSRGTWIEIQNFDRRWRHRPESCPSRGTWIEMHQYDRSRPSYLRRAPHGARGLKYYRGCYFRKKIKVVPLTGHVD